MQLFPPPCQPRTLRIIHELQERVACRTHLDKAWFVTDYAFKNSSNDGMGDGVDVQPLQPRRITAEWQVRASHTFLLKQKIVRRIYGLSP